MTLLSTQPSQAELEEAGLNAWPALEHAVMDGWLLRAAEGYTRRANSVQPLYAGSRSIYEKILAAESWYRERRLPPIFRLTESSEPDGLDSVLADRGYAREAATSVQWMPLESDVVSPSDGAVSETLDRSWFEAYQAIQGMKQPQADVLWRMLNLDAGTRRFGLLREGGDPACVGLAVQEGEWVGLYGLATVLEKRGRGLCTQMVGTLLDSARVSGARRAYLQVTVKNDSALRLYAGLGFRELYRYWYRRTADPGGC